MRRPPGLALAFLLAVAAAREPVEHWERHLGDASAPLGGYHRREPEKTLLHAVVRDHLESFLETARQSGLGHGLPAYVERELRAYLDCGILARGFARVRCPECGFERLVAFSCKVHVCPSCAARRMEDTAEHLVQNVLPAVPIRQWVLTLPRRLRFQAARSPAVASRLLDVFTRALFAWQRKVARRSGVDDPRTGGVTAVQRFGGAINLNVHFHTLVPDGVFAFADDGTSRFVRLPALRDEDVGAILRRVIWKVARIIPLDADGDFEICDSFAALQAAEIDRRLRFPDPFRATRRSAHLDGFSLHAGVRVHENDRLGLERLCRYAARPPFALRRLSAGVDGNLVYKMKRSRGGSLFLVLTPAQLLARIATLVPPPRTHAIRYHGLFAPNARARSKVVPASTKPTVASGTAVTASAGGDPDRPFRLELTTGSARETAPNPCAASAPSPVETRGSIRYRVPWAELLQKVFAADVLACPDCGGRLRLIAFVSAPAIAKQILDHLGIDSQAPPLAKARTVDEVVDAAPEYDCIDPVYGGE